jgi:hypothetical protein
MIGKSTQRGKNRKANPRCLSTNGRSCIHKNFWKFALLNLLLGPWGTQGGGHTGAMTGAIVVTSLVLWPAAPFFLFMPGKDITIPKGTQITAFVQGDMRLDANKFQKQLALTQ